MSQLKQVLLDQTSEVRLDIATLELASIEFPSLDFEPPLFRLDHFADQIQASLAPHANGLEFIRAVNNHLFDDLHFRGNEGDYYDPRNSCLNSVISRRLGIPISLSVLYIEVCRRLGRAVQGVGLPGHFIIVYQDFESRYWIDPFNHGRILSFEDCCALARETAGVDVRLSPQVLEPVDTRQILTRMLTNLKNIYLRGQALDKARQVLDLLILATPHEAEDFRLRGLIHLQQLDHRAAKSDLDRYLELTPPGAERKQVEQQLILIERWKAKLN